MRCRVLSSGSAASLLAGFLLVLSPYASLSQDPVLKVRPKEDRDARLNAMHRITMNVQVTDAIGNPVADLHREDFTLFDNNEARSIVEFRTIDGRAQNDATQIVILLDAVNTPAPELDKAKNAIFRYLAESHKPLAFPTVFALWFNGNLDATPATTDRNTIGRAFVKLTKTVHSNACQAGPDSKSPKAASSKSGGRVDSATCRAVHFKDSIAALDGIAQQQLTTGARTLLIWMGAGWPTLANADVQKLMAMQQHDYARQYGALLHDLLAAQMTVYSLMPGSGESDRNGTKANQEAGISDSASHGHLVQFALDELAERTGGKAVSPSTDPAADLHACVRDAQSYYMISFYAPAAHGGLSEAHSLALKIDRPGVEVRTMTSYYNEP